MVTTTRRVSELREQCLALNLVPPDGAGREELMDILRQAIGTFDPRLELDPMKARDLNKEIDWRAKYPFASIGRVLNMRHAVEPKLDGVRLRAWLGLHGNTLNSGRRSVRTMAYTQRSDNFPHLRDAVVPELAGTVLDGELLAPGPVIQTHTGNWTDSLLNASVALTNGNPIGSVKTQFGDPDADTPERRKGFGPAVYHVFDIMFYKGDPLFGHPADSMLNMPYAKRRELLAEVVKQIQERYPDCNIVLVPSYVPASAEAITQAIADGYEGVVIKALASTYEPGARNGGWYKIKVSSTADAFVVGYNPGENANTGKVGSLNLAVWRPASPIEMAVVSLQAEIDGKYYVERAVAQVGNLTAEMRDEISAPDGSLKQEFYGTVVEFKAQGLGKNGRARHAQMLRLRPDKTSFDCLEDQLDGFVSC